MDASYYSLIERAEDGHFEAWIPDLPGVTASGNTEDEVLHLLSRCTRECLRNLILSGTPVPRPRPVEELPRRNGQRPFRQLLIIIG